MATYKAEISIDPKPEHDARETDTPTQTAVKEAIATALAAHFGPRAGDLDIKVEVKKGG